MSLFGPYDETALSRLLARALKWTQEERAYHNERFREIRRQYARHLRFERNARQAWDDWLATTRIARPENDDASAAMSADGVDFEWGIVLPESRLRKIFLGDSESRN